MKYRSDFVTNSSSSSFLVCFKNTAEMKKSLDIMLQSGVGSQYVNRIFQDISDEKVTFKEACEKLKSELRDRAYDEYYYSTKKWDEDFKKRKANRNIEEKELYFNSTELKELIGDYVDAGIKKFKDSVNSRGYFSLIEYGDDSDFFAELEHRIMPNMPFVYSRFSHH